MLVVDPWHWLDENGCFPADHPKLWPKLLRIAHFVDSGSDLQPKHGRETLLQCRKRSSGKACGAWMWVARTATGELLCYCPICGHEEMLIHNWDHTLWALNRTSSMEVLE